MENYDYGHEENAAPSKKSIKGYQIIIIVLAVILAGLSFLYYNQMSSLKKEYAIERDTLSNRIMALRGEYDLLQTENDTINFQLGIERERADSLLESLSNERNLNRQRIRQYEQELGTLRTVMRNYVNTIDSLNTLNLQLVTENRDMRQQVTSQQLRADMAEEKADELSTRIRQGAVIRARDIALVPLTERDREVTRARNAVRLRVDFVLSANELATPGSRSIYARVTDPDGYILAGNASDVFDFEGDMLAYSATREVDYQNSDLPVSIFYNGAGIVAGKYSVAVYMDGYMIGMTEIILR